MTELETVRREAVYGSAGTVLYSTEAQIFLLNDLPGILDKA